MSTGDCGLIVFLRLPEIGKVKTRIASILGPEAALAIYTELTDITLDLASKLNMPSYLFYDGGLPPYLEMKPSFHYLPQIHGDLGEKMLDAIQYVLDKHSKAIIIGSDCPSLSLEDIVEASHQLDTNDIVIGPSEDGGYYLLACKELIPSLFKNMIWSTSSVFDETIHRIARQRMSYHLLRKLHDIDEAEGWTHFLKSK